MVKEYLIGLELSLDILILNKQQFSKFQKIDQSYPVGSPQSCDQSY